MGPFSRGHLPPRGPPPSAVCRRCLGRWESPALTNAGASEAARSAGRPRGEHHVPALTATWGRSQRALNPVYRQGIYAHAYKGASRYLVLWLEELGVVSVPYIFSGSIGYVYQQEAAVAFPGSQRGVEAGTSVPSADNDSGLFAAPGPGSSSGGRRPTSPVCHQSKTNPGPGAWVPSSRGTLPFEGIAYSPP